MDMDEIQRLYNAYFLHCKKTSNRAKLFGYFNVFVSYQGVFWPLIKQKMVNFKLKSKGCIRSEKN